MKKRIITLCFPLTAPYVQTVLPKREKRGNSISTRSSSPEYAEIMQAVKESGIGKTKWARTKLVTAARRA